jgi:hypothetical protein
MLHKRFYEKVVRVKADLAALLEQFFSETHKPPVVTWEAVKGAVGAFILTLDSFPSHFIIELGTKRRAVQLSFVP